MKVLVTQKIAGISGSEKYYFKLFKGMRNKNVELTFLAIIREEDKINAKKFTDTIEELGFRCDKIFIKKDYSLSVFYNIKKYLDANKFDIVQSNLVHTDFWFGMVKLFSKNKFKLLSIKHGYQEKFLNKYGLSYETKMYDFYYFALWFAEKFVDYSISKSNGLKALYINLNICKAHKIETVYHGFDLNPIEYQKKETKNFIIVGRLIESKGVDLALKAFEIVLRKHKDYKLQILGSGPLKEDLIKLAQELKIADSVEFVGFTTEIDAYFKNAEIVLMPTKGEGFGMVFLEAIEYKIPMVAFDIAAGNEILQNNKTGYLVKPFDVEVYAEKIIDLIENESTRKAFAENAFTDAQNRFALNKMIDSTLQVYKKMLSK